MGKKVTNEYLANKLSYSIATIHRALNNCPGVDTKTKHYIRDAAKAEGYLPELPVQRIAVILPAVPDYFWGQMRKQLISATRELGFQAKHYIYQSTYDVTDALQCLETAVKSGATVFIAALPDTPPIRNLLEQLASQALVLLLEQFIPVTNAFFIGGDPYRDGYRLAKKYRSELEAEHFFAVVRVTEFETEKERIRGFTDAIRENGTVMITDIPPVAPSKTTAAYYARELSAILPCPGVIFCPSGRMHDICLGANKMKTPFIIIGFDARDGISIPESPSLILSYKQNTARIAETAITLTQNFLDNFHYPEKKHWYITTA